MCPQGAQRRREGVTWATKRSRRVLATVCQVFGGRLHRAVIDRVHGFRLRKLISLGRPDGTTQLWSIIRRGGVARRMLMLAETMGLRVFRPAHRIKTRLRHVVTDRVRGCGRGFDWHGPVLTWSGQGNGFLEKRTKKLLFPRARCRTSATARIRCFAAFSKKAGLGFLPGFLFPRARVAETSATAGTKVFCFFSSEKKAVLAFWAPGARSLVRQARRQHAAEPRGFPLVLRHPAQYIPAM